MRSTYFFASDPSEGFIGLAFPLDVKTAIVAEVLIVLVCTVLTYLDLLPAATATVPDNPYPIGRVKRV